MVDKNGLARYREFKSSICSMSFKLKKQKTTTMYDLYQTSLEHETHPDTLLPPNRLID